MFDLRYHVASLAAVFLALIIGIVVGVGISGKGFVSDSERSLFNERIADLKSRLDSATTREQRPRAGAARRAELRRRRLPGADGRPAVGRRRSALVFAGPVDGRVRSLVEQTLDDAGGASAAPHARAEAADRPADAPAGARRTARRSRRSRPSGASATSAGGSASDFVAGGDSPLWQAARRDTSSRSSPATTRRRSTASSSRAACPRRRGATARFLAGFYAGLGVRRRARGRRRR